MENKDKKVTSANSAAVKDGAVETAADKVLAVEKEAAGKQTAATAKETKPTEKKEAEKEAKPAEKKEAEKEAKPAEKVEAEKEAKPTEKKGKPGRKPGTSKAPAKKKPAEKVEEVYVQFQELEITTKEIVDKAKQIYISEGHRESSIKSLRLYIKPDEHMAYYVINEKLTGSIEL